MAGEQVEIDEPQVWELEVDGRSHRVETSTGGWSNSVRWLVDGELIATKKSAADDNLELEADEDHELADQVGAIKVRFTGTGRPRRVTHFAGERKEAKTRALMGTGGVDMDPEPGSKAARREDFATRHPVLGAADDILGGLGKILIPLAIAALIPILRRLLPDWDVDLPTPDIPWPDWRLPSIPWPDLDLPSIPWPDLPDLPAWLEPVIDSLELIWPLLVGIGIAWAEYKRRKRNRAAREERQARRATGSDSPEREADDQERPPEAHHNSSSR
ncbi:hypothetical protein GCM10022199_08200 [Marihabitans asiaticum]|uniref:Uncharacterized protein n=1 Tax=Marihabitans asiaticum TaxID=415218 RepID=A0A560WH10_9MICO|nr:hypothetical protein [Marihabitans asiaticum]TWD16850.1 hypothetical protein FB557_0393 [Marihabitans asiaticum]